MGAVAAIGDGNVFQDRLDMVAWTVSSVSSKKLRRRQSFLRANASDDDREVRKEERCGLEA